MPTRAGVPAIPAVSIVAQYASQFTLGAVAVKGGWRRVTFPRPMCKCNGMQAQKGSVILTACGLVVTRCDLWMGPRVSSIRPFRPLPLDWSLTPPEPRGEGERLSAAWPYGVRTAGAREGFFSTLLATDVRAQTEAHMEAGKRGSLCLAAHKKLHPSLLGFGSDRDSTTLMLHKADWSIHRLVDPKYRICPRLLP